MPNWKTVLTEISQVDITSSESAFDKVRRKYLNLLFEHTNRNVIVYYSGFLSKPNNLGTSISDDDKNGFMLCINELERNAGLDLILHTQGGDVQATISLVKYLRSSFGNDIRAIIPQLAMSAGTMIACSCKEIIMGRQSSLGPIDPQFGIFPAVNVINEIERAYNEIIKDPNRAIIWNPILNKINPAFITTCQNAIDDSKDFLEKSLKENMLMNIEENERANIISKITNILANFDGKAHNTHFHYEECKEAGLNVKMLENDDILQDLVLTIHHCNMHSLNNHPAYKIIENHLGRNFIKEEYLP